jgi:hypothetical protein
MFCVIPRKFDELRLRQRIRSRRQRFDERQAHTDAAVVPNRQRFAHGDVRAAEHAVAEPYVAADRDVRGEGHVIAKDHIVRDGTVKRDLRAPPDYRRVRDDGHGIDDGAGAELRRRMHVRALVNEWGGGCVSCGGRFIVEPALQRSCRDGGDVRCVAQVCGRSPKLRRRASRARRLGEVRIDERPRAVAE